MFPAFTSIIYFMGIVLVQSPEPDLSQCIAGVEAQKERNFEKAASLYSHCIIQGNLSHLDQSLAYGRRGIVLDELGKTALANQSYQEVIKSADRALNTTASAVAFHRRGYAYQKLGMYQLAIADFNKAISIDPVSHEVYGTLAWLYATCRDEMYRDGSNAIRLARQANQMTHWENVIHLEALAAAYAETGDFIAAENFQRQVLALIEEAPVADIHEKNKNLKRLELYQSGKAFREEPRQAI